MLKINLLIKRLLVVIGSISIGFGILGIFLPILPTTPFLLLGAACYMRGSEKLYNWLLKNKYLGSYITSYYEKRGLPLKAKIITTLLLWLSIGYSTIIVISNYWIRLLLLGIGIAVSSHILTQKTLKPPSSQSAEE